MKKILIGVISMVMVLGLSVPSMAAWVADGTGDTATGVTSYDIEKAKVELFPSVTPGLEEYMNICVDMNTSLPGALYLEFDVDPAVGNTTSLISLFAPCTGGGKIRPNVQGTDMNLLIFLRDQTSKAASAYGNGCLGPPAGATCMLRDRTACIPCTSGTNCYTAGSSCLFIDDNCYVRGDVCLTGTAQCTDGGVCSSLTNPCDGDHAVPCNVAKIKGEWGANHLFGSGGMANPTERGRIDMPLPKGPGEGDNLCVQLPWKSIVQECAADAAKKCLAWTDQTACTRAGCKWDAGVCYGFNATLAETPGNVKWSLATYYDVLDADDFIKSTPTNCLAITDVIPNAGTISGADAVTGGMVARLMTRSERAMTQLAAGAEMDYDICKGLSGTKTPTDQAACLAAGCYWYDAPSAFPCQLKVPILDFDKALPDATGGGDFNILKREFGRPLGY